MKHGPLLAVLVVVLAGAALTHVLRPARSEQPGKTVTPETAPVAADPDSSSVASTPGVRSHREQPGEHREPDALEVERRRDEAMRLQEKAFEEEALDTAWSTRQTALVNKALSATAMAQYGAAVPSTASVECHSRTCRIVATYPDEDQREVGQYAIVSAIGNQLAGASSYLFAQPDGSQKIVMYARAVPAPPKGHH